jgi:hypothetical protein
MDSNGAQPGPGNSEKAVRAIFRDHAGKMATALLSPAFRRIVQAEIKQRTAFLNFLKREARRKKHSNAFLQLRRHIVRKITTGDLGSLATLNADQRVALAATLDLFIDGMLGKPVQQIDPVGFMGLQRKIFIQPKKRGPKFRPNLDEVFHLAQRGKTLTEIALAMYPQAYEDDSVKTLQKLSKAVKRRERVRT